MDYLKGLLAGPEMALSLGSGMLAQPLSGLAGLLALPAGAERAANAVRATQERLTYQPQTDGGQRMVGALGGLMAPVGQAFEAARRVTGDAGYAVGGPLGGALGAAVPDALSMVPMGALFRGLRGAPQRFPLPNQAQAGAIVYHSSPHKFDKFDSAKMGTGEGVQAWSPGTYLADSPKVSGKDGFYYNTFKDHPASVANGGPFAYKVDLPDQEIAKMVDFSKPIAEQPEAVRKVFSSVPQQVNPHGIDIGNGTKILNNADGKAKPGSVSPWVMKTKDGQTFGLSQRDVDGMFSGDSGEAAFMRLSATLGSQEKAAEVLRNAGIPGVRYFDGQSRGAGQGTSNYVVFPGNEGLLKILERQ